MAGRLAALAAAALAGCTSTRDAASAAYAAALPDRFYLEASQSPFVTPDRWGEQDEHVLTAGLSWDLSPTEVRIVDSDRNAWDVVGRWQEYQEPVEAPVAPADGLSFEKDAEGGWSLDVPTGWIVAILAALGLGAEGVRRRRKRGKPAKPDTEQA